MLASSAALSRSFGVTCRGRSFQALDTPRVREAARQFCAGTVDGTLQLIDAVAPRCDRLIDLGAYFGLTACYAASGIGEIHAFEASLANFAILEANIAANPRFARRMAATNIAVGVAEGEVRIYGGSAGDPESSIFRDVQRRRITSRRDEAAVPMRAAANLLTEIGLDERTLLLLDIEGAEYDVIPTIADLLAVTVPIVHVSFRPLNIVVSCDEYVNAVVRLRSALAVAEALAHYRYMYVLTSEGWTCIDTPSRMHFLRHYLLAPKRVTQCAIPQYGFTDSVVFSEEPIANFNQ